MPATAQRILLIVPTDIETGRGILRGVRDFARDRPAWTFQVIFPHAFDPAVVAASRADGVIAHLHNRSLADIVRRLRKPVVNVSNVIGDALGYPRVGFDDAAVGRVAAEHFLERGFRNFAYCGYRTYTHSQGREQGYRDRLAEAGFTCDTFVERARSGGRSAAPWSGLDARVGPWLRALPRPVAVFAPSTERGFELLEVCRQEGLHVPHDVAVLGVDNDAPICDLATPPLSAVRTASERTGFEAAALLARLLAGQPAPRNPILIPPGEVVVRQSTDVLAVADRGLEKALRFVRANIGRSMAVDEAAAAAGVSRRAFERRFRQVLGVSPLKEIRRLRLELAQRLLVETHLPMSAIAERCGFATQQMFTATFRQQTGRTPSAYRQSQSTA